MLFRSTGSPFETTPSRWEVRTDNKGLQGDHFAVNVYSTYSYVTYTYTATSEWLRSPVMLLDSTSVLKFDLARTSKNGTGTPSLTSWSSQNDDRFYVVVSTDGGLTWDRDNAISWGNNSPYGIAESFNYSFSAISTTGTSYMIDMSRYAGKEVVIGFHAESTIEDYDLDLHLGNISMTNLPKGVVNDQVCENNSYSANGFNISRLDIAEAGNYTFSRITSSKDSMIILHLTVVPNKVTTIHATICQGDTYSENGFNEKMSGLYTLNLNSEVGCDSIVELYLMVMSDTLFTEERTLCSNELPYVWNGQTLTSAGVYNTGVAS